MDLVCFFFVSHLLFAMVLILVILRSPASWYTNPQTEAFCTLLGIPNQINPAPEGFKEAQALRQAAEAQAQATRQALADEEKVKREGWAREERERREEWEALELIKAKEAALAEIELLDVEEEVSGKDVEVTQLKFD